MTEAVTPAERQYLAIRFRSSDQRTYTYHNDREPVAVGDMVDVPARDDLKTVEVVEVLESAPPFATKAIIGRADS